jgi:outer membrane protein TolC
MNNAVEELSSNKENVAMAEKAYSISRKQFEVGMGTWLDLSASELALTQARLAYHQSIYNYLYNMAELENIIGINKYQNQ